MPITEIKSFTKEKEVIHEAPIVWRQEKRSQMCLPKDRV
jgi:hypothetical protein